MSPGARLAAGVLPLVLVAGCSAAEPAPTAAGDTAAPAAGVPRSGPDAPVAVDDPRLEAAVSRPATDSVYPAVGDPVVDALHYDLDLAVDPATGRLEGRERLVLRATADAGSLRLDLSRRLTVGAVRLDGREVAAEHRGDDLVVVADVAADSRHVLEIDYAGVPRPAPAPTTRTDFSGVGWHTMPDGDTWTMQEPYGAFTWYAVDDQPADKALYDIAVEVPAPRVGVATGRLRSRTTVDGTTRTEWRLDEPAASYLVTVVTGRLERRRLDAGRAGVPVTLWLPPDLPAYRRRSVATAPAALAWLERRLGPYPFDTLGLVVVDSESAMETQTMVTLGDSDYVTSPSVVLHEIAHQWYGDQVTPDDWRDLWMSEGMTMYLQLVWEARHGGTPLPARMAEVARADQGYRDDGGPPAAYDPERFGATTVYLPPALMWHRLRQRVGDRVFWSMVRAWPRARDGVSTGREDHQAWVERRTGLELDAFFDAWLLGDRTPEGAARP